MTDSHCDRGLTADWWPPVLRWHADEVMVAIGRVKLALIENHEEQFKHRHVYAALGDPAEAHRLVVNLGFKGHDPDSSGPHPSAGVGGYEPRFWVFTDGTVEFEPLAIRWEAGGQEVVLPDQGLLMTYGLVPRLTEDGVIHWDDLEVPVRDCITVKPSTSSLFGEPGTAFVEADGALVQDYSSLRGLSAVQVYYVESAGELDAEVAELLGGARQIDIEFPGRSISLKQIRGGQVLAQCWGIRLVFDPGELPLTEGRWDYPELDWPGIGVIKRDDARMAGIGDHGSEVFVRDTVLGRFEGVPDFDINPELGAVSYKNQWGVGWCNRYGRDLIRVDLKKLYEGARPEIIRHYHEHAVEPPLPTDRGWDEPNIATRTRRLAFALADVGASLRQLAGALGIDAGVGDLVGVIREDLEDRGWWSDREFEVAARHIPPGLSRDAFLSRCSELHRATVDRLGEAALRRIVLALGFDREAVRQLGSLKLLELIVAAAGEANSSGLDLVEDREEVVRRLGDTVERQISALFKLNDLRLLDSHPHDDVATKLADILRELDLDPASAADGYDLLLDVVYDLVGNTFEEVASVLGCALT